MKNKDIIFNEEQRLAEEGKIKYTGKEFKFVDDAGNEIVLKETEQIHTFTAWKELGYIVKKGQKAIAKFMIWKYVSKKSEETEEENSKMFMKMAAFFSSSQVEKIAAN